MQTNHKKVTQPYTPNQAWAMLIDLWLAAQHDPQWSQHLNRKYWPFIYYLGQLVEVKILTPDSTQLPQSVMQS